MTTIHSALLFSTLLLAHAPAQSTWTVPGNFPNLQAAFDSPTVVDGDTIVLGVGSHAGATGKALRLFNGAPFGSQLTADFVGVNSRHPVVIKGIPVSHVYFTNCTSRVHVEGVSASNAFLPVFSADNCAAVTLANSSITGGNIGGQYLLFARNSRVVMTRVNVSGGSAARSALDMQDANVSLAGCTFTGVSSPAINMSGSSELFIRGDASTRLTAGAGGQPAIRTTGGTVHRNPGAVLTPSGAASAIDGPATVLNEFFPSVSATGVPPGQNLTATVYAPSNTDVVLIASIPQAPADYPPFGSLWFDPSVLFYSPMATTGAATQVQFTLPVPANAPNGFVTALQAVAGTFPASVLSVPAVVILR